MAETVGNRTFFNTHEEMFDPGHTALLVIDMQNDYTHEEGYYARKGIDLSMIRETVPRIQLCLKAARKRTC